MASKALLQAIGVTAELTGTNFSEQAARLMANDLSRYPEKMVMGALDRCRKELRGRLTIADVVARLEDGRPGPEEAWSIVLPALEDERVTVVWTDEMAHASFGARHLVISGDKVAARMAFVESYRHLVNVARDAGTPPRWLPSLGLDPFGREGPLREAVRLGRLPESHAALLLPSTDGENSDVKRIATSAISVSRG